MNTPPRLAGRELHRRFGSGDAEVNALIGVDIEVPAGQLTVVTGPSGSGKTTLLNLLGGLDRPSSGEVVLDGFEVLSALPEDDVLATRRDRIGYVFQTFGLIPVLSAAENVETPLRLRGMDPTERAGRVAAILERVGLARHARQRPHELSGGQQQRVGVARALVGDPDILIADEPTGQLDSDTAATIMDLIVDLTHERGLASVISTHDPLLIARADRVVRLLDGTVVG
ncbi:putative ABC transport system ATP-binding protein [Tessaracoccus bendigoensis DSM 12906]|uniref:Putative ABC transport system ATP-binding protein n=1 Tax=Tessaracoccus bendigoensis DSM 12906 TaxID=1123357 RepID=A0A1M6KX80_9ACTN|nr:ABC transporter ATP-binding protein [Tessaracoccus bendigoensis]SHJ63571.1 putative ABC transport system ATP-binding protein [Tessaracoccus bendigoensis DSM 12906]